MNLLVYAVLGYLLGSVPFAVLVSRAFRLADPRSFGSGNPGATNVLRSGNKAAALLTLLGDAAKGWLAMFVAAAVGADATAIAVAGLAAFLGHVFPFTLGFKGGKGVATAAGACFGLLWPVGLAYAATWLVLLAITRISSVAGMAAPVVAALTAAAIGWWRFGVIIGAVALLILWLHRANIRRLLAGEEPKVGRGK